MPLPKKRFWLFYTYAVLSWLYGYYVIYKLIVFMKPHLEPFGLEGLADWFSALALTSWVVMPLHRVFQRSAIEEGRLATARPAAALSSTVAVDFIGIFGAACFLPVELTIKRAGAVHLAEPDKCARKCPASSRRSSSRKATSSKPAQPLARLSNRETEQMLAATENRFKWRKQMVQRAVGLDKPAEHKQAESYACRAFKRSWRTPGAMCENLTLRAKTGGTVLDARPRDESRHMCSKATIFSAKSRALDPMRIKVALSEKQVRYVKKGQRVAQSQGLSGPRIPRRHCGRSGHVFRRRDAGSVFRTAFRRRRRLH